MKVAKIHLDVPFEEKFSLLALFFLKISSLGLFTWKAFEIANFRLLDSVGFPFQVGYGSHSLSMWCHLEWCMSHPIWARLGLDWVCYGSTLYLDIFKPNLGQFMLDRPMIKMDQKPINLIKLIQMIQGLIERRIWEIWNIYSCVKLP